MDLLPQIQNVMAILILGIVIMSFQISNVFASSASDYVLVPQNTQGGDGKTSSSSGYRVGCQQVGDTVVGKSESSDYKIFHGFSCGRSPDVSINLICLPDNRYLALGPNYTNL